MLYEIASKPLAIIVLSDIELSALTKTECCISAARRDCVPIVIYPSFKHDKVKSSRLVVPPDKFSS